MLPPAEPLSRRGEVAPNSVSESEKAMHADPVNEDCDVTSEASNEAPVEEINKKERLPSIDYVLDGVSGIEGPRVMYKRTPESTHCYPYPLSMGSPLMREGFDLHIQNRQVLQANNTLLRRNVKLLQRISDHQIPIREDADKPPTLEEQMSRETCRRALDLAIEASTTSNKAYATNEWVLGNIMQSGDALDSPISEQESPEPLDQEPSEGGVIDPALGDSGALDDAEDNVLEESS
ncbi:hypothetical protein TWF718_008794 [Orbilia javanica]|uniref:Uncharacterized protein n=1 Tax=Orbilia javanica TaxID=47235 RepID=A0AAN8MLC1_9PEZI